jgi:dCTP deaminase
MTVLSAQAIRRRGIFTPFCERSKVNGMSYGLSACGYDIRIEQGFKLFPGEFKLASTVEHFDMPADLMGIVHDKSTWARLGVAVQNTVIEPGWRGFLTLELTNHSDLMRVIEPGAPIAQVILHNLDEETEQPYAGRYQDQQSGVQVPLLVPADAEGF